MVEIQRTLVTKKRHTYRISSPATARDIYELMLVIRQDIKAAGRDDAYDDAFHIESWDDELRAYWDEDEATS